MHLNYSARTLGLTLSYGGPLGAGRKTNLEWLHAWAARTGASPRLVRLGEGEGSHRHLELVPGFLPEVRGFTVHCSLTVVPPEAVLLTSARIPLSGIDGVVFVADSHADRQEENQRTLTVLEQALREQTRRARILVLQYNKRDLPGAMPLAQMRSALNRGGAPEIEAMASRGVGVLETFELAARTALDAFPG